MNAMAVAVGSVFLLAVSCGSSGRKGLMMTGNGKALVGLLRKESDPELKKKIIQQLSMMDDDEAMDEIERLLTEKP